MSTKDIAYDIIDNMSDEQLQGFVMMFRNPSEISLSARIRDIENGRNLSETFESFDDFFEDLNAENSKNSQVQPDEKSGYTCPE